MQKESHAAPPSLLDVAWRLHQAGDLPRARAQYLCVLRETPLDFDAHYLLGLLEAQDNNLLRSAHLLSRALSIAPEHQMAHWHLGEAFIQLKFYEAAIECFRRARHQSPNFLEACVREGNVLRDTGRTPEALSAYLEAVSIDPLHADVQFSLGNIFKGALRLGEAIAHYKKSIIAHPEHPDPYVNLGNTLKDLNQLDAALVAHAHASSIQPKNPVSLFNQSLIRLLQGDMESGWALFETRWDVVLQDQKRHFRKPLWTGREDLAGRTLFVYPEQGLGDSLQFCRYLPILSARGVRVIFEAPPELKELLKSLKGAITLISPGFPIPEFDYYVPLLSVPGALGTNLQSIPCEVPYLKSSPDKNTLWQSRVQAKGVARIGLAWSGGNIFRNDRNRSFSLEALDPILSLPYEFHAIQKEVRDSDRETLGHYSNLSFHGPELMDFSDTAALIESMDLILTVDTSVAHLAGALNKPVWVMLPFAPDFRWLLDRSDSPWYPSARLFRQDGTMAWAKVVADVREALVQQMG